VITISNGEKLGYDITYDYSKITEFLQKYYTQQKLGIVSPKYKLCFMPRWIFSYHAKLDTGQGWVNAIDSRVVTHMKFLDKVIKTSPLPIDTLFKIQKFELILKDVKEPIVTDAQEVERLIKYKIPLMLNKQDVLVTNIKLVYVPFWETELEREKKKHYLYVNALDESDIERTLMPFIEQHIAIKKKQTEYDLFYDTVNEFSDPKSFFSGLIDIFSLIGNSFVKLFKWIYKKNRYALYLLLLLLMLLLIYFAYRY